MSVWAITQHLVDNFGPFWSEIMCLQPHLFMAEVTGCGLAYRSWRSFRFSSWEVCWAVLSANTSIWTLLLSITHETLFFSFLKIWVWEVLFLKLCLLLVSKIGYTYDSGGFNITTASVWISSSRNGTARHFFLRLTAWYILSRDSK